MPSKMCWAEWQEGYAFTEDFSMPKDHAKTMQPNFEVQHEDSAAVIATFCTMLRSHDYGKPAWVTHDEQQALCNLEVGRRLANITSRDAEIASCKGSSSVMRCDLSWDSLFLRRFFITRQITSCDGCLLLLLQHVHLIVTLWPLVIWSSTPQTHTALPSLTHNHSMSNNTINQSQGNPLLRARVNKWHNHGTSGYGFSWRVSSNWFCGP